MHSAVHKFIKEVRRETRSKYWLHSHFRFKNVLEVGSLNVNGSPRKYFWWCKYTGVDMMKGKGVDIVRPFAAVGFSYKFDVVISTEMLEHDWNWATSLKKMYDLVDDGGLLIVTCAAPDRPEHGTRRTTPEDSPATTDYYRNISLEDFRSVLPAHLFSFYMLQYARGSNDLQFYGIKPRYEYKMMMQNYG